MTLIKATSIAVVLATSAAMASCASSSVPAPLPTPSPTPTATPAVPTPPPSAPIPPPLPPSAPTTGSAVHGPWPFAYTAGEYTYSIALSGNIAQLPDTTKTRLVSPSSEQVTLTIGDSIVVTNPTRTTGCTTQRGLVDRVAHAFPKIPSSLVQGATWTDSVDVESCSGTITTQLNTLSRYHVVGDTVINGTSVVQIDRNTTFTARGEGNHEQHRILLNATGVEIGSLYLDPTAGQIISAVSTQRTTIDVTTSGKVSQFIQHTTETIARR